jgi:aspartyl-tRNA(Asn)/glutamyl-tRNA(Gln) amidotransferase subunit A
MIKNEELKVEEYIEFIINRIKTVNNKINAFITINEKPSLKKAKELDKKIKSGKKLGKLIGIPVAVKDNICTQGIKTTCASRMLENFIPPYDATVISSIKKEDGIIIGKTNLDEFAMGSSTEYSYFGATVNPLNYKLVAGGSSGGSAAAVRASMATLALGSDTGGSVRCPASFCSLVGLKPTYGSVSRYGLISYANSLEQISPITKDVHDSALLFNCISGYDPLDSTSVNKNNKDYKKYLLKDINGIKIGIVKEFFGEGTQDLVSKNIWDAVFKLEDLGAKYEETSLPNLEYALPSYYIIAMSEASSNLARYDGLRYGFRIQDRSYNWHTIFSKDRKLGFGQEVKRRIILGSFTLSSGYYDEYYLKAQKIRTLIKKEFDKAFAKFDALIGPTMPILPFKIGEKVQNPLVMYMCDVDTVPANLTGIPSISIPCSFYNNLPIGLQIMASPFREDLLFRIANTYEHNK